MARTKLSEIQWDGLCCNKRKNTFGKLTTKNEFTISKKRAEYSESFKGEAIAKVKDNNGNIQTAKEIGIPINTLANWQKKANSGTDNYSPDLIALQTENKELKKQLKIAQEEREILNNEEGNSEALLRPDARRIAILEVQRCTLPRTKS